MPKMSLGPLGVNDEGIKLAKVDLKSSFHMSNLKSWSPKIYDVKGPNMHNHN